MEYRRIDELPREKLLELCELYAKNWLAMDGVWFQSVERKFGLDEALEHDAEAWRRFTVIEARRIKAFLALPERPGLDGLARALRFRFYGALNQDEIVQDGGSLIYRVVVCRVQDARRRKGMAYHPCKPIGLIEYSGFAAAIDDRIATEALSCHPEVVDPTCNCMWRFTLSEA